MRLFKKAAVCLLAAAMAVSMLTACGGDAGGGSAPANPGNGNNTSVSGDVNPSLTPGDTVDIKVPGSEDNSITATVQDVTWNNSRTAKLIASKGITKDNYIVSGMNATNDYDIAYTVLGKKEMCYLEVGYNDSDETAVVVYYTDGSTYYVTSPDDLSDPQKMNWNKLTKENEINMAKKTLASCKAICSAPTGLPLKFVALEAEVNGNALWEEDMTFSIDGANVSISYLYAKTSTAPDLMVTQSSVGNYMIVLNAIDKANASYFPNL